MKSRDTVLVCSLLAACGGDEGDDSSDAGPDGGGAVAVGTPDNGLNVPLCADNEAYVRLALRGPKGGDMAWAATEFTECHGGTVSDEASLQFNMKGAAGEGDFMVTLVDQAEVAVGEGLRAEVHLNLDDADLILVWREGCVANITDVRELGRTDTPGAVVGLWERYTGSVRCDTAVEPLALIGPDEQYTLAETAFQGISYRLVPR